MSFQKIKNYVQILKPKDYGRSIPIIASELVASTVKEKRFYLALIYFVAFPLLILLLGSVEPAIQTGPGIAIFQAHTAIKNFIPAIYISFFLGQILIVLLNADAISGEIEEDTFPLLRSKPVYDSEIIMGKFFGMVVIIALLDIPILILIYIVNLVRYDAEFPATYLSTIDEILGATLLIILLQCIVIALTLVFSTIFSRSLYSILSSMLGLFVISQIAGSLGDSNNYLSFQWLVDAILPKMLYHLEPLESSTPSLLTMFGGLIGAIIGLLTIAIMILRQKELN
ncbi:MAG: ABC transporter permease subunit [Candidatus Heimdallarchaeota archaeon]|nr:ABC transporter permease subunit [Candidatus Heimdallarchaeota archaeon]